MLGIKRLYIFILKSFMPLFVMTFFICLFIVLIQFLWRYIDDLVGKGIGVDVLGELFFYAALSMVPMALPLAILLASLMTFGNLGERFELTAMKASGISLLRVMRPLIIFVSMIAVGAFFFQNNVLPIAQTKMWTLLFSIRQSSPELEIPEGVFYDQIPGYNFFVAEKNRKTGMLYDIMIYDMSKGFDNAGIILADSGRMAMMEDKTHLFLRLWEGESFDNLKEAGRSMKNVPYRRETFSQKDILVPFDANFNRMNEDGMRNQYVGKNIAELSQTIDSLTHRTDSIGISYGRELMNTPYLGISTVIADTVEGQSFGVSLPAEDVMAALPPLNVDSIFAGASSSAQTNYMRQAINKANFKKQEYAFRGMVIKDERRLIRRHEIELHKKFTLSFSCLIFFFIGAPLGAIIRKGGLGTPLVISVLLFIFYYLIDNTGYKMARDGTIIVWVGMWFSSCVLLPLSIFVTYKAVHDSAVFKRDAYSMFFRSLIGRRTRIRHIEMKELVMEDVDDAVAIDMLAGLASDAGEYLANTPAKIGFGAYWLHGYPRTRLHELSARLEDTVDYLADSRSKNVINTLKDYPIIRNLWLYHPASNPAIARCAIALFPISFPIYLVGRGRLKRLRAEIESIEKVSIQLQTLISES